ncbi:hypothetical protein CEP53_003342 [Fusarium sp. AF-6]|nr:hypothetical protein CEP53_003342 [Fusarium sp. AF-6]
MGVMDLPTLVRGRRTVTLGIWSRYRASQDGSSNGRTTGVEIVTGLPRSLLDIFAEIQTERADELLLMWPDALCETCRRPQYSQSLATNSILYPYTAARLEVAVLVRRPEWVEELRRLVKLCDPYAMTANFCTLDEMLDEALDKGDDDYDIDEQARRRNTEVATF